MYLFLIIYSIFHIQHFILVSECHRFDQSTLGLLLGNLYDYEFRMYRDKMSVSPSGNFVSVNRGASFKDSTLKICSR